MAAVKPYRVSWEEKAKDLEEVNRRLSIQLYQLNQMLEDIFTALNNLTSRVEALE